MNADSIARRKQRWCDLLDPAKPGRRTLIVNYDSPDLPARPRPWPDLKPQRIEWSWQSYLRQLDRAKWLDDDRVPFLDPYTGTEIFAEAFGCRVHRPEDNNPFALPMLHAPAEVASLRVPDLDCRPLADVFELADELRRRAGDDAVMRLPDIQSPMDVAALIFDKNDFFVAMLDAPQAVTELAAKVRQLMVAFLDEWFARYGREFVAHYPWYYMPVGLTLSADEVGAVSREVFDELFAPELAELSRRYGGLGVHCCACARHQWEGFLAVPDLRLINLVQPDDVLAEAHGLFADVAQMHIVAGTGEAETWPDQYPPHARFVFEVPAQSEDDAKKWIDRLRPLCS